MASAGAGPSSSAMAIARFRATIGVGHVRQQLVVELHDLRPVGGLGRGRVGVHGGDRRLDLVRARHVAAQAGAHEGVALVDQCAVPQRAVLIGRGAPTSRRPRRAPAGGPR